MTNIFEDDFAFLGDDDSGTGNRKENTISEYQSFTDLQHSKGKAVSAIHWLPHRKVSTYPAHLHSFITPVPLWYKAAAMTAAKVVLCMDVQLAEA